MGTYVFALQVGLLPILVELSAIFAEWLITGSVLAIMGRDFASGSTLRIIVVMRFLDRIPRIGLGHTFSSFLLNSEGGGIEPHRADTRLTAYKAASTKPTGCALQIWGCLPRLDPVSFSG